MYRDNLARPLPKQQEAVPYQQPKQGAAPRSERSKREAKEKLKWLGTILVCIVIALGLVSRYASMVSLSYELETQKSQLQGLQDDNLKLEQQMLEMESPERIKSYASNKLGMKSVQDSNLIILPGSSN
ncbi:septum formation initiator family protein [Tumebacillus sp. BK434]|uniref:cell division protein FtsL n=1 Tax=Tumebacillus sp. BK434 TaxID=2512169 RepID=UPI0014044262|nr:septum formation initiator family protein [Tumebacillus sp. BK434]